MNERIKEITGQVLDELVPETWTTLGYNKIKEIQHRTAELIVEECLKIVEPDQTSGDEWCVILDETAQSIRQHFGLELKND